MLKPKPLLLLLYCFFIVFLIYNVKNNSTSTVESPNEIVEIPNEIVDENEIVQEKRNLNNPYFISYLMIFLLLLFVTLFILVIIWFSLNRLITCELIYFLVGKTA